MYNGVYSYPVNYGIESVWDLLKSLLNPFYRYDNKVKKQNIKIAKKKPQRHISTIQNKQKYENLSKIDSKTYNTIRMVHSKDGIKWYKGDYDEFDLPVSALSFKDSIVNPKFKSIVYYDEEITCAYIDYDNKDKEKIKNIELRQNGTIYGLKKQNNEWLPYFINEGITQNYSKAEIKEFYFKIKNILKKAQSSEEFSSKMPINELDVETDRIYLNLIHNK